MSAPQNDEVGAGQVLVNRQRSSAEECGRTQNRTIFVCFELRDLYQPRPRPQFPHTNASHEKQLPHPRVFGVGTSCFAGFASRISLARMVVRLRGQAVGGQDLDSRCCVLLGVAGTGRPSICHQGTTQWVHGGLQNVRGPLTTGAPSNDSSATGTTCNRALYAGAVAGVGLEEEGGFVVGRWARGLAGESGTPEPETPTANRFVRTNRRPHRRSAPA